MNTTKLWVAAGAALAASLGVPAVIGGAGAASADWVPTATLAQPAGPVTDLGATPAATPTPVSVVLALRNRDALDALIASGRTVTAQEFVADFAPAPSTVASVEGYLQRLGFTGVSVSANHMMVSGTASAAQAGSAFDTTLHSFAVGPRTAVAAVTPVQVPGSLAGAVTSVLGLNTIGSRSLTPLAAPSTCGAAGCSYNPQGLQTAYDATGTPPGVGTPIAVFAEGNLTQVVKDLRTEEAANGLRQVPVTIVATGKASADTSGIDEWDLDSQFSAGMAGAVSRLYLYDAPSLNDSDITTELNAFVSQDVAKAGNMSFGECEAQAYTDGSLAAEDQLFEEAAAQGQTVFASSGDSGGFCPINDPTGLLGSLGLPIGTPSVNYPASSPYVVGVGGTTLLTAPNGTYSSESAWAGGGGGVSMVEKAAPWQTGLLSTLGRTVPDMAMDADPATGANVIVKGKRVAIGGTSLSSPLALGAWARMETAAGNRLGFASPLLYKAGGSAAFHDITTGDSIPYPALPGYDLATGLGTFDVARARAAIG